MPEASDVPPKVEDGRRKTFNTNTMIKTRKPLSKIKLNTLRQLLLT